LYVKRKEKEKKKRRKGEPWRAFVEMKLPLRIYLRHVKVLVSIYVYYVVSIVTTRGGTFHNYTISVQEKRCHK
jgi:hypothetical protein